MTNKGKHKIHLLYYSIYLRDASQLLLQLCIFLCLKSLNGTYTKITGSCNSHTIDLTRSFIHSTCQVPLALFFAQDSSIYKSHVSILLLHCNISSNYAHFEVVLLCEEESRTKILTVLFPPNMSNPLSSSSTLFFLWFLLVFLKCIHY